jgi:hypothetical protein
MENSYNTQSTKSKEIKQKSFRSVHNDIASLQEDGASGVPPNVHNVSQTKHATEHFVTTSFNKLLRATYFLQNYCRIENKK